MSRDVTDAAPISSRDELIEWIAAGEKPKADWRVGTEHEKVPFLHSGHAPVPYEGETGIRALIEGLAARTGWEPILEEDRPIGLADDDGGGAISIEPGGQFELSGAPMRTVHETARELDRHLADARAVAAPLGIGFLSLGMSPKWSRAETPVMPKRRSDIMRDYMPKVGSRGLDMMLRTATVQANLDFASEADMVGKLRASLALQPLVAALFANSPFSDGRPNGFLTMRSEIWRDTDPDRTGLLPFAFEDGMGYERYVDYALDVPMYFVKRGDTYHDVTGQSFRDLLDGKLATLPGERATRSDWANHLSTIFPEVRLKRFIEMRGQDVGAPDMIAAEAAIWVGLLYDAPALDGVLALTRDWSGPDRQAMRDEVPRLGLRASVAGRPLRDVAREVLALARTGLATRGYRDEAGRDEAGFLDPLDAIVEAGETRAELLLRRFEGEWGRSVEPVFHDCAF